MISRQFFDGGEDQILKKFFGKTPLEIDMAKQLIKVHKYLAKVLFIASYV